MGLSPMCVTPVLDPTPDGFLLRAQHPSLTWLCPTCATPTFNPVMSCSRVQLCPTCATPTFNPVLSCSHCTRVRPNSRQLSPMRFAFGAVNPPLKGSVAERNDSRPFSTWPNVPPPLSSNCYSVLLGFLVTFFPCSIFQPPSLVCLEFFPFSGYTAMAPSSRTFLSTYSVSYTIGHVSLV